MAKIAVEMEGDEGKRLLFPLLHQRLFFLKGLLQAFSGADES